MGRAQRGDRLAGYQSAALQSLRAVYGTLLVVSVAAAAPAQAGDRYLGSVNGEQVVVQYKNDAGIAPPSAPMREDIAAMVRAHYDAVSLAVGNYQVQTGDPSFFTADNCGYRTDHRLVLCVDQNYNLNPADQLTLLAFSSSPVAVYSRSARVESSMRVVLAQIPDRLNNSRFAQINVTSCGFECERVVVLDK